MFSDSPRGQGSRVYYIQKDGGGDLNKIVLGTAAALALILIGIGAWGVSNLVSTREEVAGMRTEMRIMNERLGRLEQRTP